MNQLVAIVLFYSRHQLIRSVSAFNVLLYCMKCLSFARGFESWGVLVRMIVRILDKIGHFLCVMALLIVGFGISFSVALGDLQPDFRTPWDAVLWLVNAGMYGYGESESTFGSISSTRTATAIRSALFGAPDQRFTLF